MRCLRAFLFRLRTLFGRSRHLTELDEEIRFHLEQDTDKLMRRGLSREEATRQARLRLGGPEQVREQARAEQGWRPGEELASDVRFSLRTLGHHPGFTAVAVFSLAVGIGVNAVAFSMLQATWLRTVPGVVGADRVVEVLVSTPGGSMAEWAYPDFADLRRSNSPIATLAGWKEREGVLTLDDNSSFVQVNYVSADYFEVLGVTPVLGRTFLPSEEEHLGAPPVIVLGHGIWQERFGGDPDIVGRTIELNRTACTVVGVAPEGFGGHYILRHPIDLWAPLLQHPLLRTNADLLQDRENFWLLVLGRLRDGATIAEADAALETIFARLSREHPESNQDRGARVYAFGPVPALNRDLDRIAVGSMIALVGLALLIICGNVAGMVLARSATREREFGVRLALGAGRGRLVRQLLVEALVLSLLGGGLGTLLALWGTSAAFFVRLTGSPETSILPDASILGSSLVLILVTTLAVGLIPSIRFSRPDLVTALKSDTGGGGLRVGRIHRWAASAQTGVALFLLVIGTLFVRGVGLADHRDPGFDPQGLLVASLDLGQAGYESLEQVASVSSRMMERIAGRPGVTSVTLADGLPLDLIGNFTSVSLPERTDDDPGAIRVEFTRATEGFFRTIGATLLRGRGFEPTDDASSQPVVVITETLSERLWPQGDGLGKRIRIPMSREDDDVFTVVGVVRDVASSRATEDWPQIFIPLRQTYARPRVMILVRGEREAVSLVKPVQTAILEVEPGLPIPRVETSQSLVARSTQAQRDAARVAGGLGLLTLLLSAIGVYGVVAFAVTRRTREIGIRMTLGATRERVLKTVLKDAVRLALPGTVVGVLLALGMAAVMRSELFGLNPLDPVSFGLPLLVLLGVVLLASLVPARRASGIQPVDALRWE
jgi:predicted permease